ncbi:prepilin peptidase [Cohnella faecalis]|uniref:prepilin peptidase n=1 Tax=Cohnella faecalis TaxID=2315694 RepID=UPI00361F32E7
MNEIEWGAAAMLLFAAAWTDLTTMRIPNALNAGFAVAGLLYQGIVDGSVGLGYAIFGALAGMLPLGLLLLLKGMGGGDVKWFGAFGIWAGAGITLQLVVWSILIAGVIAVAVALMKAPLIKRMARKIPWPWGEHPTAVARGVKFPFMLAVVPGLAVVWTAG